MSSRPAIAGSVVIWGTTPVGAMKQAGRALADCYSGNNVQIEVHVDKRRENVTINVRDIDVLEYPT